MIMAPLKAIKETELIDRLSSETPKWFKNIIYGALALAAFSESLHQILMANNVTLSPFVENLFNYILVGGTVAALVAKTACKATPEPRKKK